MPLLMCPNCQTSMQSLSRADVEFDMCPACRGVWLDRGELEKIMEGVRTAQRAPPGMGAPVADETRWPSSPQGRRAHEAESEYGERGEGRAPHRRKRGFDLFDIFD